MWSRHFGLLRDTAEASGQVATKLYVAIRAVNFGGEWIGLHRKLSWRGESLSHSMAYLNDCRER